VSAESLEDTMSWFNRGGDRQRPETTARELHEEAIRQLELGNHAEAIILLRKAIELVPDAPNSHFLLGLALYQTGDSGSAIGPLRECVAMLPNHDDAHLVLSGALGRLEEFDLAEEHCAKAASLGNEQARTRLRSLGADYCRRCGGPARFGKELEPRPDILFFTVRNGMTCKDCHTILCGHCASGGQLGIVRTPCPKCGQPMQPLTR
jgi:Flp pilus assembly protein TadD